MSIFIPPTDGKIENGLYFCLSWIQRTLIGITGPHDHLSSLTGEILWIILSKLFSHHQNWNPILILIYFRWDGTHTEATLLCWKAQWPEPDRPSAGGFPPLEPGAAQSFLLLKRIFLPLLLVWDQVLGSCKALSGWKTEDLPELWHGWALKRWGISPPGGPPLTGGDIGGSDTL